MGRIAEFLEHPGHMASHAMQSFRHHPMEHHHRRSGIGGIIILTLLMLGLAWMWPEIQRYAKMRRM